MMAEQKGDQPDDRLSKMIFRSAGDVEITGNDLRRMLLNEGFRIVDDLKRSDTFGFAVDSSFKERTKIDLGLPQFDTNNIEDAKQYLIEHGYDQKKVDDSLVYQLLHIANGLHDGSIPHEKYTG